MHYVIVVSGERREMRGGQVALNIQAGLTQLLALPVNKILHLRLFSSSLCHFMPKSFHFEEAQECVPPRPPQFLVPYSTLHLLTAARGRWGAIASDTQHNASVNGEQLFL